MRRFGSLLINEWLKLYKKRTFVVPYVIMAGFVAMYAFIVRQLAGEDIGSALAFAESAIGVGVAGQLLPIIAIVALAGIVSGEYRLGTIKFLLIRAHSRHKILASKYVVALLYSASLILFTAATSLVAGLFLAGFGGGAGAWGGIMLNLFYLMVYTTVYITLMFMIGVWTRSSGVTVGITMFGLMIGGLVTILLSKYSFAKYILFANADLSQYRAGEEPIMQGMSLPFSSSVLAVYLILFLAVSFIIFRKRDVS